MEPSETRSVWMKMLDGNLDRSFLDGTFGWNLDELDGNLNYLDETRSILDGKKRLDGSLDETRSA